MNAFCSTLALRGWRSPLKAAMHAMSRRKLVQATLWHLGTSNLHARGNDAVATLEPAVQPPKRARTRPEAGTTEHSVLVDASAAYGLPLLNPPEHSPRAGRRRCISQRHAGPRVGKDVSPGSNATDRRALLRQLPIPESLYCGGGTDLRLPPSSSTPTNERRVRKEERRGGG